KPISFPRSAWECSLRRSASRPHPTGTRSVRTCVPTRSVGTRVDAQKGKKCGTNIDNDPGVWFVEVGSLLFVFFMPLCGGAPMDKSEVAAILDEIGTLLEIQGENSFRCNAYHTAARVLQTLSSNLTDVIATGKLGEIPGIGDTLKEKITTL